MDDTLTNLELWTDKKLEEVDVTIASVSTSILLMEDTIALATLALPTILDLKGWVTDAVATERLAAGALSVPPHILPGALMPPPCFPTGHGLAAMESNLATNSRA